jgi:hypothetical protein
LGGDNPAITGGNAAIQTRNFERHLEPLAANQLPSG